jgi:predicted nuclease of predicted toxin-antitoxin system
MKFLVDMPLSPKDRDIFDYAEKHDMIILSADLDFGTILAFTHSIKPSVIIFRLNDPSHEHVNSLISSNIPNIEKELKKGVIVIIEDAEIRIRELPIGKD